MILIDRNELDFILLVTRPVPGPLRQSRALLADPARGAEE